MRRAPHAFMLVTVFGALAFACGDSRGSGAARSGDAFVAPMEGAGQAAGEAAGQAMGPPAVAAAGQQPDAGDASRTCPDDRPPEPSPECAAFVELFCGRHVDCVGGGSAWMRRCERTLHPRCVPLDLPGSTLDAARLQFCSARVADASCALIRDSGWLSLGMAFCASAGTLGEGAACDEWFQCRSRSCDRDEGCSGGFRRPSTGLDVVRDVGEAPIDGRCHNEYLMPVDGVCQLAGNGLGEACPCSGIEGLLCTCEDGPCCQGWPNEVCMVEMGTCQPPPILAEGDRCGSHPKGISYHPGVCAEGLKCYGDYTATPGCVREAQEGEACESAGHDSSTCASGLRCVGACSSDVQGWTGTCVRDEG